MVGGGGRGRQAVVMMLNLGNWRAAMRFPPAQPSHTSGADNFATCTDPSMRRGESLLGWLIAAHHA